MKITIKEVKTQKFVIELSKEEITHLTSLLDLTYIAYSSNVIKKIHESLSSLPSKFLDFSLSKIMANRIKKDIKEN